MLVNLDVAGWRLEGLNLVLASSDDPSWPYLADFALTAQNYPCGTQVLGVTAPYSDTADMASFWEFGYRGFLVGSAYALTGWMNTSLDTFDNLDLEQCANVARIVVAYLAEQAGILADEPDGAGDEGGDDTDDEDDDGWCG